MLTHTLYYPSAASHLIPNLKNLGKRLSRAAADAVAPRPGWGRVGLGEATERKRRAPATHGADRQALLRGTDGRLAHRSNCIRGMWKVADARRFVAMTAALGTGCSRSAFPWFESYQAVWRGHNGLNPLQAEWLQQPSRCKTGDFALPDRASANLGTLLRHEWTLTLL
jgi:hypothetical protein